MRNERGEERVRIQERELPRPPAPAEELAEFLDAWAMLERRGAWPVAGGWAEQSIWLVDALRIFEAELGRLEMEAEARDERARRERRERERRAAEANRRR